jgi:DNA polymerase-3 subunit delta
LREARAEGIGVSREAVAILKELFEDTGELASEARKVACACALGHRREISVADVEKLCLSDGNRNLLKLLDGLCAGRVQESLASLGEMGGRSELLPLLSALHNRFRLAMYFAMFPGERADFAKMLDARDYASRNAEAAARKYGAGKLGAFVNGLIRIASSERVGQGSSWRDLSLLVIGLLS